MANPKQSDLTEACTGARGRKLTDREESALVELLLRNNPTIATKLGEIDFAARNPDFKVRKEKRGVDLINKKTGKPGEHKAVVCTSDTGGSVNFHIPVQKAGESDSHYKQRVYDEQLRKGDVYIDIKSASGALLATEMLPAEFIAGYVSNLPRLETRTNLAVGVRICKHCRRSHKLDYMKAMSARINANSARYWAQCYEPPPKCKKPKK